MINLKFAFRKLDCFSWCYWC